MSEKKIVPPPRKSRLPEPPAAQLVTNNLTSTPQHQRTYQDLNFKVAPEEHQAFKIEAAMRGLTMVELFRAMKEDYHQTHGRMAPPPEPKNR